MGAAKTLLFQSCQLQSPSVRGLMALCVIGVQNSDMNLIDAALAEMGPHAQDPKYENSFFCLLVFFYLLEIISVTCTLRYYHHKGFNYR
jgi:hypothetical protein